MLPDDFNTTIDQWIAALRFYSLDNLLAKPAEQSWSMGQLYNHLLNETNYFVLQMAECAASDAYANEQMSDEGKQMFDANRFPDQKIVGNLEAAGRVPQPKNITSLRNDMLDLRRRMNEQWKMIANSNSPGKTQHPGLGFFNAMQWFQFSDMHMRHHFRQKKRIEDWLKISGKSLTG